MNPTDRQNYAITHNGRPIGAATRPQGVYDQWIATLSPTGHSADRRTVGHFSTAGRAVSAVMDAYEASIINAQIV
jgi:hypothetical protein